MSNWIKQVQTNGTLEINDEQLFFPVNISTVGQCMARWAEEVPVEDLEVSYDLTFFDSDDVFNASLSWETRFRWNITSNDYYAVRFNYFDNNVTIHRVLGGTSVHVVTTVSYADWNPGQSYNIKIFMRGNTIDVLVNDSPLIANAQDNYLTGTGYVGIGARFFGVNTSNNGPHWDNFAIEFLDDLGIQMGGGYAPIKIAIPASGGITTSGTAKIGRRHVASGGVTLSGIAKIIRRFTATGGIEIAGEASVPRKYRAFGGITLGGKAKPGLHYKGVGGLTTGGGIPYVRKITGIGSEDEISVTGECGGPFTVGILNYNWLTYTVGKALTGGTATASITTKNYHYIGSGGLTTDGRALVGRRFTTSGGISLAGEYIYGPLSLIQKPSGGVDIDGSPTIRMGYGGSGLVSISGSGVTNRQIWTITASGRALVSGRAIVKASHFQYLPDLRLGISQSFSGNNIKPYPITTLGSGTLEALLNLSTNELIFYIDYSLPSSTPTGIKLYLGNVNENGTLVLDLGSIFGLSTPIAGSITVSNVVKESLRLGNVYIVVESDIYPTGEIRAQHQAITPLIVSSVNQGAIIKLGKQRYTASGGISVAGSAIASSLTRGYSYKGSREVQFLNTLTGSNVVPPSGSTYSGTTDLIIDKRTYDFYDTSLNKNAVVPPTSSPALGYAIINYDLEKRILSWTIVHQGLSSAITNITFNTAASGSNGPVIVNVPDFSGGNTTSPIIGSCNLRQDQYNTMLLGTYITIKTTNFPSGEIRGQFVPQSTSLASNLTITHDIPASQINRITLNCPINSGGIAPIVIDITNYTTSLESPIVFQKAPVNAYLTKLLCANLGYLQIETISKPDGELRANLTVRNGGATINATAITPGKVVGLGGVTISGTAVIGIGIKGKGSITTGGVYGRSFRYSISHSVAITTGGSASYKLSLLPSGGVTVSGTASCIALIYPTGGVTTSGSAAVSRTLIFSGSGIIVSGSAKLGVTSASYIPNGGATLAGTALIRATRKYNVSSGCTISGTALIRNVLSVIATGGIDVSGTAVVPTNHYHYAMNNGCVIAGRAIERTTIVYNVTGVVAVGGKGHVLNVNFQSSNFSPGMNVRLVIGASVATSIRAEDVPYPSIVQPRYCEFRKNKLDRTCKNGAFVPPSLRSRQRGYMPAQSELPTP